MDTSAKQKALADAVALTQHAIDSADSAASTLCSPENTTEYLEAVYRKLCELHRDSLATDA